MTAENRRASIIEATVPLLRSKGRRVSTKEIARAAGIAEGTIFRVFKSKDELVHACVHEALDNTTLLAELHAVDRQLPLRERLAAAVALMQAHLEEVFALMSVLQSSGPPLQRPNATEAARRRRRATAELDDAFVALIGDDGGRLRIPVRNFIGYLRMLTLSSVHPMLDGQPATPIELVDVVLEGALARPETGSRPARGRT